MFLRLYTGMFPAKIRVYATISINLVAVKYHIHFASLRGISSLPSEYFIRYF